MTFSLTPSLFCAASAATAMIQILPTTATSSAAFVSILSPAAFRANRRPYRSPGSLPATIYYPDDWVGSFDEDDDFNGVYSNYNTFGSSTVTPSSSSSSSLSSNYDIFEVNCEIFESSTSSSSSSPAPLTSLAERLNLDEPSHSFLAKLASAFAPPGRDIALDAINQVTCVNINERRVEIEAVVCDELECVCLFVPVDFPFECSTIYEEAADGISSMEACVMENLSKLEAAGERTLEEKERRRRAEEEARGVRDALGSMLHYSAARNDYNNAPLPSKVASWSTVGPWSAPPLHPPRAKSPPPPEVFRSF